jgi:hypothetical protein
VTRSQLPLLVVGVLVAVASVAAGAGWAASDVYVNFQTPSGNIGCGYAKFAGERADLRCEIVSGIRPLPPHPARCGEGDWGRAVGMGPTGRPSRFCITDTVMDPRAPVLAYGRAWRRGPFRCASQDTGLTCRNRDGHGWFLSRAVTRLF